LMLKTFFLLNQSKQFLKIICNRMTTSHTCRAFQSILFTQNESGQKGSFV
jgi:hypothetical protein